MSPNVVERIQTYNSGRIPALVAIKYKKMRENPFVFFRGANHLFYEDWPGDSALNSAPLAWLCSDLHLENFGTYKGDNRQVYFDVNDFDEGALAPCTWDAARFLTSLFLAASTLRISEENNLSLCNHFLETYFKTLAHGHLHSLDRDNADGVVEELMDALKTRRRRDFLDKRSEKTPNGRKFKTDNPRYQPVENDERRQVTEMIQTLAKHKKDEKFYEVHDVAFRITGTGSLGMKRYTVLIEGRGSPDDNFILDVKEERASALEPYLSIPQPKWVNHAERVTAIQKFFLDTPPALLTTSQIENTVFVIKELQPTEDHINLGELAGKSHSIQDLITSMAKLLAWGELRSAGHSGSASVDELSTFGERAALKTDLLDYAQEYFRQTQNDFRQFAEAYDTGKLKKM